MVVEVLKIRLEPSLHSRYLELDAQIWTKFLETCPGFVSKQAWINSYRSDEITFVIYWQSREQWKVIDKKQLEQTDAAFFAAFGQTVPIVESLEYEVV
jgi:uncharacterized protein (TIGR03792 family)